MPDPNWVREYLDGQTVPGTPYRIARLIGAGGMGSVYEVEHIELGRRYVLKSLLSTLTSRQDLAARMRNEWRALGQIRHPNIVDVLNAGLTANGTPYYVMELLSGETVRERLELERRIAPGEAARIARSVLLGLEAAHAIGIVHRDVKPANVFLTRSGEVKLLDFGIAKVHLEGAPKITAKGLAVGTPRYMAPEQAAGEKADSRSDVYAAGLLLFEMIVGRGPFDDCADHASQMDAHLHRLPPKVTELVSVPEGLSGIVARALEKDQEDRFASARKMADSLLAFASGGAGSAGQSPLIASVAQPEVTPAVRYGTPRPALAAPLHATPEPPFGGSLDATPPIRLRTPEPPRNLSPGAGSVGRTPEPSVPYPRGANPDRERRFREVREGSAKTPAPFDREARLRAMRDSYPSTLDLPAQQSIESRNRPPLRREPEQEMSAPLLTRATLLGAIGVAVVVAGAMTAFLLRREEPPGTTQSVASAAPSSRAIGTLATPPAAKGAILANELVDAAVGATTRSAPGSGPGISPNANGVPQKAAGKPPRGPALLDQPDWSSVVPAAASAGSPRASSTSPGPR